MYCTFILCKRCTFEYLLTLLNNYNLLFVLLKPLIDWFIYLFKMWEIRDCKNYFFDIYNIQFQFSFGFGSMQLIFVYKFLNIVTLYTKCAILSFQVKRAIPPKNRQTNLCLESSKKQHYGKILINKD